MDDINILFHRQGVAFFAHASANTSASRAASRAVLAECDRQLLDARNSDFPQAAFAA